MKMKSIFISILFIASFSVNAAVNDYVVTSNKVLGQLSVNGNTYYFQSFDLNWGVPNCPNARYAYIRETDDGAKAILAAALTAKASQTPISFAGLCGDSGGSDIYIRVNTVILP
jgi:hypothetical protein